MPSEKFSAPYKKGDFIGQKYEVYDVLGMGGFGIVYLVYSHETKFVYALKTCKDEYLEDREAQERFKKEAQIWINMDRHPYLVRAHFVNAIPDRLFIAIDYIAPGENGLNSLDGYLRRIPPDLSQSLRWGIQFCYGMGYAYSKGIRAHRDIKPANIMIAYDKTLKITDFGIAGVIGSARISEIKMDIKNNTVGFSCQTVEGSGFGTPTHMPPEQFTNAASCDERSDIYSFGIVLYQMAAGGSLPFLPNLPANNSDDEHIRFWHDMHRLHSLSPVPRLNSPLFPIIQRCLEKEPKKRYQSFADLRLELEPLLKKLTGEVVKAPERKELEAREWNNKGFSLGNLGKHQEAIACFDRMLEIDPRYAGAWYNELPRSKLTGYQKNVNCC
ncbi:MAG: protein kinase, partial [Nanoarchaeota archaeon]